MTEPRRTKPDQLPNLLVLFDIDGTLIEDVVEGKNILLDTVNFVAVSDVALGDYSFDGKTDPQNAFSLLKKAGVSENDAKKLLEPCLVVFLYRMGRILENSAKKTLPGVSKLLETLSIRQDMVLGLLTGNTYDGAKIKLKGTGLESFFSIGAYGSDSSERENLPAIAVSRANTAYDLALQPEQVVIIGDTKYDVQAAHHFGATAISVLTGPSSRMLLKEASPDYVFEDLQDTDEIIRVLTGLSKRLQSRI